MSHRVPACQARPQTSCVCVAAAPVTVSLRGPACATNQHARAMLWMLHTQLQAVARWNRESREAAGLAAARAILTGSDAASSSASAAAGGGGRPADGGAPDGVAGAAAAPSMPRFRASGTIGELVALMQQATAELPFYEWVCGSWWHCRHECLPSFTALLVACFMAYRAVQFQSSHHPSPQDTAEHTPHRLRPPTTGICQPPGARGLQGQPGARARGQAAAGGRRRRRRRWRGSCRAGWIR